MTNLFLGIFICIILVVLYIRPMEHGAGVTDAEIEEWLEWREEWKRRQAVEEELRGMGAEEMEMAGQGWRTSIKSTERVLVSL